MSQTEETKIAVAQEQIKNVQADVLSIKNNHLPHIYEAINDLAEKVDQNNERTTEAITKLRVSIAWYVGIAVGAVGLINILVTLFHKGA